MNRREFSLLASAALLSGPALAADAPAAADTIYIGGDIITMNVPQPRWSPWP